MKFNKSITTNTYLLKKSHAGLRTQLFIYLYQISMPVYRHLIKGKRPKWQTRHSELRQYPLDSLGYQYALFLEKNKFHSMDNFENHDALHIILEYPTDIKNESAMQFCLLGNGKKSLYMYSMVFFSTLIFPENISYFHKAYLRGKRLLPFHQWNFETLLKKPVSEIKSLIGNRKDIQ